MTDTLISSAVGEVEDGLAGQGKSPPAPSCIILALAHVSLSGVASGVGRLWKVYGAQGACLPLMNASGLSLN